MPSYKCIENNFELMEKHFFPGFSNLVLEYLDWDVEIRGGQKQNNSSITLFGKNISAIRIARDILLGDEKPIAQGLEMIKEFPNLLSVHIEVLDHLGRCIKGTILQIAAMMGDITIIKGSKNQNDLGLVERLIAASNLTAADINSQLSCVTSSEAKQINANRNQQILDTIIKFGENIISKINVVETKKLDEYQIQYQDLIVEFKNDLQCIIKKSFSVGFIFDPIILHNTIKWFIDNLRRFENCYSQKSDIFWVHGFGFLQKLLCVRDRQILNAGIYNLLSGHALPRRSIILKKHDSGYIGLFGDDFTLTLPGIFELHFFDGWKLYEHLSNIKISSLEKIYMQKNNNIKHEL